MTLHHEQTLVRYLLGELEEDERTALEDEYFGDDRLFERLQAAETDLIDAYVAGRLTAAQREAFEARYLASPEQVARVDAARRLLARVGGRAPVSASPRRPALYRFAAIAASVVVVAGSFLLVREMRKETVTPTVPAPATPMPAAPSPAPPAPAPATLTLGEGATRSAGIVQSLAIAAGTEVVHLLSPAPGHNAGARFRAAITTPEGTAVHTTDDVAIGTPADGFIRTIVPARSLAAGDYILTLSSIEAGRTDVVAEYSFRIIRP